MALTETRIQITWAAANSVAVAAGGNATSDSAGVNATTVERNIQCKAAVTTPVAGDTLDFYLLSTLGDPEGVGGDEYTTPAEARWICRLEIGADGSPQVSDVISIPSAMIDCRVYVVSEAGSTQAITASAQIREKRSA